MAKRFITKGRGAGRKVIPLGDKATSKKTTLSAETKRLMNSPLADEFDLDVVKAVTDEVGEVNIVTGEDEHWIVIAEDGKEYMMFEDENSAEHFAVNRVTEDLEDQPELFTQDWLMSYVDEDGLREDLRSDEDNRNWDYVNDIEDESDDEHSNRLKAELVQRGILTDEDAVTESAKGEMVDQMTDESLRDPIEYLKDLGYEGERLMDMLRSHIDIDEASQDAVDTDGVAHFLASYDGNEVSTDTGHVLFRTA